MDPFPVRVEITAGEYQGSIIDKVTGIPRECLNSCLACTYEINSGPEICLDNFLKTIEAREETKNRCSEDYEQEFCSKEEVKMITFSKKLDVLGGLKIEYNQLINLPEPIFEYIERHESPNTFIRSIFEINSENPELLNKIKIDFVLQKANRSIAVYVKAKEAVQNQILNIRPRYFNLLKIETRPTRILADEKPKSVRKFIIEKNKEKYTLREMEAISNFSLSRVFNSIVLNIP